MMFGMRLALALSEDDSIDYDSQLKGQIKG